MVGIDRLYQIVGDLVADGLIHDALLLALRHHHNGHVGVDLFDQRKCFQPGQSGHILVEENDVERLLLAAIDRILPADNGDNLVAFVL